MYKSKSIFNVTTWSIQFCHFNFFFSLQIGCVLFIVLILPLLFYFHNCMHFRLLFFYETFLYTFCVLDCPILVINFPLLINRTVITFVKDESFKLQREHAPKIRESIPVNKKIQTLELIITKLSSFQPFRLFFKLP